MTLIPEILCDKTFVRKIIYLLWKEYFESQALFHALKIFNGGKTLSVCFECHHQLSCNLVYFCDSVCRKCKLILLKEELENYFPWVLVIIVSDYANDYAPLPILRRTFNLERSPALFLKLPTITGRFRNTLYTRPRKNHPCIKRTCGLTGQ